MLNLAQNPLDASEQPMSENSLAVEVVCTGGPAPFIASGRATGADGKWTVHVDRDASSLPRDARAILTFEDPTSPRIVGIVEEVAGNRIELVERVVRERERRAFPRLVAGLQLKARALATTEADAETAAWMAGDDGPLDRGTWFHPDPFMNFSVTGLRFQGPDILASGTPLLLELGIRNQGSWRCVARVVRTFTAPEGGDPSQSQVAVEFTSIPDEAEIALSELTLRIQDQLL